MDIRTIKALIELANKSGIAELEVEGKDERVRITVHSPTNNASYSNAPIVVSQQQPIANAELTHDQNQLTQDKPVSLHHTINSPMVGTVYLAASPGAKMFIEVGQQVKAGDVVCLIEAMKMFNRIEADKDGVIKEILIKNAQPVEYAQALFVLE